MILWHDSKTEPPPSTPFNDPFVASFGVWTRKAKEVRAQEEVPYGIDDDCRWNGYGVFFSGQETECPLWAKYGPPDYWTEINEPDE
jgi:hypothetical protein